MESCYSADAIIVCTPDLRFQHKEACASGARRPSGLLLVTRSVSLIV